MNNPSLFILLSFFVFIVSPAIKAEENKITTVNLKYIAGEEIMSVLKSLVDKSITISQENNVLLINGTEKKTNNILHIINKIDTPAEPLTIEFIASNRALNFNNQSTSYQSSKNNNNTSQSMSITERQWVKLNTGLSIPIAERRRAADGTETQSFRFKKISKSYIFKVHEFSGWSIVQVGINASSLSKDIAGAIEHTKLNTTIVGKTNEWLEVATSKTIQSNGKSNTYSTDRKNKKIIHLYIKVNKPKASPAPITEIKEKY